MRKQISKKTAFEGTLEMVNDTMAESGPEEVADTIVEWIGYAYVEGRIDGEVKGNLEGRQAAYNNIAIIAMFGMGALFATVGLKRINKIKREKLEEEKED